MTKRIKIIVPIPMDEAGVANRASQLPAERIRDGYEVEFVAVSWGAALGDSYYDTLLMDVSVFEAGLKAEEEGYDAICIDTVSDSGLYALRSRLNIPVFGPGQAALDETAQEGMLLGGEEVPLRLGADDRGQSVADRFALEQALAHQHLPKDDSEGPYVGAAVDILAARLLRRHVGGGPEDRPRLRHGRRDRGRCRDVSVVDTVPEPGARQAEVQEHGRAVPGDHDVGRLDVPVDHAGLVGR